MGPPWEDEGIGEVCDCEGLVPGVVCTGPVPVGVVFVPVDVLVPVTLLDPEPEPLGGSALEHSGVTQVLASAPSAPASSLELEHAHSRDAEAQIARLRVRFMAVLHHAQEASPNRTIFGKAPNGV